MARFWRRLVGPGGVAARLEPREAPRLSFVLLLGKFS
jgi:hypothetical protein